MKICIFTGTRAEYGLLHPLIVEVLNHSEFELVLLASGTHLSPEFGLTVQQIQEQDHIETVEMLLSSDSVVGVAKSFGVGVLGFSEVLNRVKPDLTLIAGDRYEALGFACTSVILGIPIAHLHGGELSEGSLDEYYRHAITKLSRIHFTSTEAYRRRVIQMGEDPSTVFNVGAIGLDNIRKIEWLSKDELERILNVKFGRKNVLVTYHPEHTVDAEELKVKFQKFLMELSKLKDTTLFITMANADANGRIINAALMEFTKTHKERTFLFESLGTQRYLSLMKLVDAIVGNSSSGILEAPSLGVPTVNVGMRQAGRIRAASVVDCSEDEVAISAERCYDPKFRSGIQGIANPYGDGYTAEKILKILQSIRITGRIKRFYDIGEWNEANRDEP